MKRLGIPYPKTVIFNHPAALSAHGRALTFPALLKPNQGGSGARMHVVESIDEVRALLDADPSLWLPDNVLLLQEYLPHDTEADGVIRMEYLGEELLYAMRVRSKGGFNLCPSETCNPVDGEGVCEIPTDDAPSFEPFPDVPAAAVEMGRRIMSEGGLDVGGIEYLETPDGRRVFYDINANSNLRRPIGEALGFDPFERVADFLERELAYLKELG
jgi:glutathione synthase/RimK-type ligase-like ATP-grasp enzyme